MMIPIFSIILILLHLGGNHAKDNIDVDLLVKGRSMMLRRTCPEGIDRCHCLNKPGTLTRGPFYFDEDPIQASITHITCTPDFCYCKDTPKIERNTMPPDFAAIFALCPRGKMSRCLCHDNTVVRFPFDPTTFLSLCRPKRCKCEGDASVKKHIGVGCSSGGAPWCPYTSKPESDLVCQDGTAIWVNDIVRHMNAWRSDCLCSDGFAPRCRSDGRLQTCPDGSDFDPSSEPWQGYAHRCNTSTISS